MLMPIKAFPYLEREFQFLSLHDIDRDVLWLLNLVTVGMPLTRHPPYRSVRAELPHTAPTSGDNGEIARWAKGDISAVLATNAPE